jgi:3-methylcrotonyl-CoA carboxylase alpha subunit
MSFLFRLDEHEYSVAPLREGPRVGLEVDGVRVDAQLEALGDHAWRLLLDGTPEPIFIARDGERTFIHLRGRNLEVTRLDPIARLREARAAEGGQTLTAPMPGVVVEVRTSVGSEVGSGDTLLVIESMKLQTALVANAPGRVDTLPFEVGQSFEKGALLARIESLGSHDGHEKELA